MNRNSSLLSFASMACLAFVACSDPSPADRAASIDPGDLPNEVADEIAEVQTVRDKRRDIEIVASLLSYNDRYQIHHETHKISTFLIVEPLEYANMGLTVRHAESPDPSSIWRDVGTVFRIRMPEDLFYSMAGTAGFFGAQYFEAIQELTTIPAELAVADDTTPMGVCWRTLADKFDSTGFDGLSEAERMFGDEVLPEGISPETTYNHLFFNGKPE